MHFGKNATELRLYPSRGMSYQKILEAAMSLMVLSVRVSTAKLPLSSLLQITTSRRVTWRQPKCLNRWFWGRLMFKGCRAGGAVRRARQNSRTWVHVWPPAGMTDKRPETPANLQQTSSNSLRRESSWGNLVISVTKQQSKDRNQKHPQCQPPSRTVLNGRSNTHGIWPRKGNVKAMLPQTEHFFLWALTLEQNWARLKKYDAGKKKKTKKNTNLIKQH